MMPTKCASMETLLHEMCNTRQCVRINYDWMGYILTVGSVQFSMRLLSADGADDGFVCAKIKSVQKVDCGTRELKKADFLYRNAFRTGITGSPIALADFERTKDYIGTLFQRAQTLGCHICVSLRPAGHEQTVRIKSIERDSIHVEDYDEFGQVRSCEKIAIKNVRYVLMGGSFERMLELCEGQTF